MSLGTLHQALILCYYILLHIALGARCGHDDVEYDITRNDDIEPLTHSTPSKSLFTPFTSLSSATGATDWLLHKIEDTHFNHDILQTNHDHDTLQTFSSRKNTKPHRHHASFHAFEHNAHKRHHPLTSDQSNNIPYINEDENEHIDHSVWKPFRIHYSTGSLVSSWDNEEEANHFAEDVIPAAIHYLERSLYVRPVDGKLKLSRPCVKYVVDEETDKKHCVELKWNYEQCGSHVTIPQEDFEDTELCELDDDKTSGVKNCKTLKGGPGHEADIIIYFSGDGDYGCSDVYGYSAYCHSNKYDRPIAGFVNLCADTLVQENRIFTWEQKVTLIVHEVFHVLGFSSTGFAYFRYNDKYRRPRTPRDTTDGHPLKKGDGYMYGSNTIQYHKIRDKFATFIVLPTVVKYAKKFYSCSSVIGIELEDFGGHDTAASHWEQRILGYEFMIGYIPPAAPFSIFSFGVLSDSGWYKVNWKYASSHPYGRQFGCDWIDNKCLSGDGASDMLDPFTFCTSDIDYGCSKDHIAISNCQIEEYNFNLPPYFQYFESSQHGLNANLGGRLEYADYCPMYYHYNNGDCRFIDASIKHKRFGATITPQSKCIIISHPSYHYLNLKMQGLDADAVTKDTLYTSAHIPFMHHHRRKKPLPKELGVCYKQQCFTDANNEWSGLRIEIWNMEYEESEWITCWKDIDDAHYKITQLHEYDVRCPIYTDICYDDNPWLCNGHGMMDRYNRTCVCNAGYIGCDCLYDDTKENRQKYPYSNHKKCQEYNIVKEALFAKPPVDDEESRIDVLHDIIWNEIDVHFGEYHLILFNLKMDLDSADKYVTHHFAEKHDETFNLDFIQIVETIKMLIAIPLKIDIEKVWITSYQILEKDKSNDDYNVEALITFTNQQRMSNKELEFQIKKILHKLFDKNVKMETISVATDDDNDESDYDAQTDESDTLSISPLSILRHHSNANKHIITFISFSCIINAIIMY